MQIPYVAIVSAAQKDTINLILSYVGWGPETFSRKLCLASPLADPDTPATHYLSSAAAGTDEEIWLLQNLIDGTLPPLAGDFQWGVEGVITEAEALAAASGAVLQVFTAAGEVEPVDHISGILFGLGLQYVPFPEI